MKYSSGLNKETQSILNHRSVVLAYWYGLFYLVRGIEVVVLSFIEVDHSDNISFKHYIHTTSSLLF